MITLDEIHEYQPPAQSSSLSSQSRKPTRTSLPPPLTHPLPQRPTPSIIVPEQTGNSHSVHHSWIYPFVRGGCNSPQANAFDRELATLGVADLSDPTLIDVDQDARDRQAKTMTSGLSRWESMLPRDDISCDMENHCQIQHARPRSPSDKGQRDISPDSTGFESRGSARAVCHSDNGLNASSGSGQNDNISATENGERQSEPTVVCDTGQALVAMDNPADAANPTDRGYNSIERIQTTQPVSEVIRELPADQAVGGAVPEIPGSDIDVVLITQHEDGDRNRDQTPCQGSQTAAAANTHHMQKQSTSAQDKGTDLQSDSSIEVTIPAPQPTKSRGSTTARRPHRTRHGKRKDRSTSPQDSDDTDDDDYVDTRTTQDDLRRPVKRTRQLTAAGSDPPTTQTATRSPLDGFSLPDLHAVSRAILTVEFFPSEIMYSFSWKENRDALDRLECKEKLIVPTDQGCTGYEKGDAQSLAAPGIISKATKAHTPFSQEELDLLKQLKEEDRLPWKQIKEHFPDRTEGTLQVQYSTKLKGRDPRSPGSIRNKKLNGQSSRPSKSDGRSCRQQSHCTTTDPSFASRYGAPRSRRTVDRYSPL